MKMAGKGHNEYLHCKQRPGLLYSMNAQFYDSGGEETKIWGYACGNR